MGSILRDTDSQFAFASPIPSGVMRHLAGTLARGKTLEEKPTKIRVVIYNEQGEIEVSSGNFIVAALDERSSKMHLVSSIQGLPKMRVVDLASGVIKLVSDITANVLRVSPQEADESLFAVQAEATMGIRFLISSL